MRHVWLPLAITCAGALGIAACAQVVGLADYQKVDCLDDCADAEGADVANVPPGTDGSSEAGPTSCTGTTVTCGSACVDLTADPDNCGACGAACGASACCKSACVDTKTSNANCGACGVTCLGTESCSAGACRPAPLGNGSDGPLAITADKTIDTVLAGGLAIAAGAQSATVAATAGFTAGDLVMLHQTRGAGAGTYELTTVTKVDATSLTLAHAVVHAFSSTGDARAQVVRVPQYTTVSIAAGATLSAPAWDGTTGGILAFEANGAVDVSGAIDMTGRGFRGYSHAGTCAGGARYACTNADTADGFAGESSAGPAVASNAAIASGGGGGQDGQDCGAGAGGGHGTAGTNGTDGTGLLCRNAPQLGGAAGGTVGVPDLTASLLFGGAGGEGGGDEDGAYPGAGGNGGGIVSIAAQSITVTGAIRANGAPGTDGVQIDAGCGGSGCGMGAGGGGAGGAVLIHAAAAASVGASLVTATGATGGACSCGAMPGGVGGSGRIALAGTVTGTTTPDFVAK